MKKDYLKLLLIAAVALLTVSCSNDNEKDDVTVDRKVAVLLPDASVIERWAIDKKNLENAMDQAKRDSAVSKRKAFPTVFHKKNRRELLVTMRFDDWIRLYREYYSSMKLGEREG